MTIDFPLRFPRLFGPLHQHAPDAHARLLSTLSACSSVEAVRAFMVYACRAHAEGEFRWPGLHILQNADEFARLVVWLMSRGISGGSLLEIGSAAGSVAWFLSGFCLSDRIVVIDNNSHVLCKYRPATLPGATEFIGDSHSEACAEFLAALCCRFPIVHIDGDHSAAGVLADFKLAFPYVTTPGYLIFHDSRHMQSIARFKADLQIHESRVRLAADFGFQHGITVFEKL